MELYGMKRDDLKRLRRASVLDFFPIAIIA